LTSFQGIGLSTCGAQSSYCVSTIRPEKLSRIRPGRTAVMPNPSLNLRANGVPQSPRHSAGVHYL